MIVNSRMSKLRSLAVVLGLALVTIDASAATPGEQQQWRDEAKKLTEQARGLEGQADQAREVAKQAYLAELKKADGLDDQADTRKVAAYQKWLQAGASREARAMGIRESARSLQLASYSLTVRAAMADQQAVNERSRAKQQRDAAKAILAANPDGDMRAVANDLNRQADEDDRDGKMYENEAKQLREKAERAKKAADALIARAVVLETAPAKK